MFDNDLKLYGKCYMCKRNKLFVRRRVVQLPIDNVTAKSPYRLCTPCFKVLLKALLPK